MGGRSTQEVLCPQQPPAADVRELGHGEVLPVFLLRFREGEVEETRGDPLLLGACPVPSLLASAGADLGERSPG